MSTELPARAFSVHVADTLHECSDLVCTAICAAAKCCGLTEDEVHAIAKRWENRADDLTAREIDIAQLIELITQAIIQIINACPQPDERRIVATIRRPGIFNRSKAKVQMDGVCRSCSCVAWRNSSCDVFDSLVNVTDEMSDAQLTNLVRDAATPDYILI